jgi:ABC-type metal ion transport system substrate-binding protein
MYYQIEKELNKTKSILKVSASTGLYVNLLGLNNQETKTGIIKAIIRILCSDLPKARKVLADKLLLFLMSQ